MLRQYSGVLTLFIILLLHGISCTCHKTYLTYHNIYLYIGGYSRWKSRTTLRCSHCRYKHMHMVHISQSLFKGELVELIIDGKNRNSLNSSAMTWVHLLHEQLTFQTKLASKSQSIAYKFNTIS